MRTITIEKEVFKFDELSDRAKDEVRLWLSDDWDDWSCMYDDFVRMGEILGIEIDTRPVKLMGGGYLGEPKIYWSGFYQQGDYLTFEGRYRYAKGAVKAMKAETNDPELIRIAEALQAAQRPYFYRLEAIMSTRRDYMIVEVEDREDNYREIPDKDVEEAMRDFAHWMFKQLRDEYEYLNSDEYISETCEANEYEFDENGRFVK
jgi:hypothetical protein